MATVVTFMATPAYPGRIVASGDEWPTSDFGFIQAGGTNAQSHSQNRASFLDTDGVTGGNVMRPRSGTRS